MHILIKCLKSTHSQLLSFKHFEESNGKFVKTFSMKFLLISNNLLRFLMYSFLFKIQEI